MPWRRSASPAADAGAIVEASQFSLADFFLGDSDDPLVAPADFTEWLGRSRYATALYERSLLGGPIPRTEVDVEGERRAAIKLSTYNYLGLARQSRHGRRCWRSCSAGRCWCRSARSSGWLAGCSAWCGA